MLCPASFIPKQPFKAFRQGGQGQQVFLVKNDLHPVPMVHNLTGTLSWSGALRNTKTQRQLHSSLPLPIVVSARFGKAFFSLFPTPPSPSSAELHDKRLLTKCLKVSIWPGDCDIFIWVDEWNFQPLDWQECLGRRKALSAGMIWWIYQQND